MSIRPVPASGTAGAITSETDPVASAALTAHAAAADPHPTYTTAGELSTAVTTHEGAADPHPTYTTAAELATGISNHAGAADPHPTYLTSAEGNAAYETAGAVSTHAAAADPHTGYLKEADYDANTILAATSDNTPVALTVPASSFVGRKSTGNIAALTATEARAELNAPQTTKTINAQTGTTYTAVLGDAGADKFLTMTNASASTFTVPPNSSVAFPVGSTIEGAQLGAGQVTLTPGAGVTINATPGLKVAAQYGTFGLIKTATDTWLAYGRLSA